MSVCKRTNSTSVCSALLQSGPFRLEGCFGEKTAEAVVYFILPDIRPRSEGTTAGKSPSV